ncbi:MAG: hypothetical protein HFE76_07250 [Firmicutes bacterium]|nr:hypothetical protein [Bacillota bacterium]
MTERKEDNEETNIQLCDSDGNGVLHHMCQHAGGSSSGIEAVYECVYGSKWGAKG